MAQQKAPPGLSQCYIAASICQNGTKIDVWKSAYMEWKKFNFLLSGGLGGNIQYDPVSGTSFA